MKTAVSIPDPVFAAADELAERLGVTRSELYARALQALLADLEEDRVTRALDEVYAENDSRLDEELATIQAASLPSEKW